MRATDRQDRIATSRPLPRGSTPRARSIFLILWQNGGSGATDMRDG